MEAKKKALSSTAWPSLRWTLWSLPPCLIPLHLNQIWQNATTVLPVGARCACGTHPTSSLIDKGCERQTSSNRGRTTSCKVGQHSEIPHEFLSPDQCSALKKPLIRKDLQKQKPTWHLNKQPVMGFALNCKAYLTALLVPNKCISLKIQLDI